MFGYQGKLSFFSCLNNRRQIVSYTSVLYSDQNALKSEKNVTLNDTLVEFNYTQKAKSFVKVLKMSSFVK